MAVMVKIMAMDAQRLPHCI